MKKKIIITVLAVFFAVFSWQFSSTELRSSWVSYRPSPEEHPIEQPKILLYEPKIQIPWTRYLPIFQFGRVQIKQKSEYVFGEDDGPYTSATLTDDTRRIGLLPDLDLANTLKERLVEYHFETIHREQDPTHYKFDTIEHVK